MAETQDTMDTQSSGETTSVRAVTFMFEYRVLNQGNYYDCLVYSDSEKNAREKVKTALWGAETTLSFVGMTEAYSKPFKERK